MIDYLAKFDPPWRPRSRRQALAYGLIGVGITALVAFIAHIFGLTVTPSGI